CCTSSNAVRIVEALPSEHILFVPDQNLAGYVQSQTRKAIIAWDGNCYVHHQITPQQIAAVRKALPHVRVLAHPECRADVLALAVAGFPVLDRALQALLVRVRRGVFTGRWALPGGRVQADETLEGAARRLLAAETGVRGIYLEQLYTFGHPERDPHGRVVSVAYFALIPHGGRFQDRARAPFPDAAWCRVARLPPLAYDHRAVVRTALARLRAKL